MSHNPLLAIVFSSATAREELEDSNGKNKDKVETRLKELRNCDLYIIINPKTNEMATPEFIAKHVVANENKVPTIKGTKTTCKPKILTLEYRTKNSLISLSMVLAEGKSARPVRCWDLKGHTNSKISQLLEGYQHMLDESESEAEDEEFEMRQPGDEDGIQGLKKVGMVGCFP